jgi:putative DNA primase/helicase
MSQRLSDEEIQKREDKATADRTIKAAERKASLQERLDMIEVARVKRVEAKKLERVDVKIIEKSEQDNKKANKKTDKEEAQIAYLKMVDDFLKENPIHYDKNKMYWSWNWSERIYESVDDTEIMNDLTRTRNIEINEFGEKNRFLEVIRQHGRRSVFKDLPLNFIQFKDFVVDIETNERFLATPEYFYVNPIPHNLGSCGDTPTIDKFFSQWVDERHIETLYEILAYMMYKRYPIERWFFLLGIGSNGKGKFIELISKYFNKNNVVSTRLDILATSRFETARLYKKSVAVISEANKGKLNNVALLKSLTGDEIPAERKGIDGFNFINYAKVLIASNTLPETTDESDGFYRRTLLINFPNQFKDTGYDILDEISEEEYEKLGYKLIEILKKLLKSGKFTNEGSIEHKRERFGYVKNPVKNFIKKYYDQNHNESVVLVSDFINSFTEWRSRMSIHDLEEVNIMKTIKSMGFKTELSNGENSIIGLSNKIMSNEEKLIDEFGSAPKEQWD